MSAIYVADPQRFVEYYVNQAKTGKASHTLRHVQQGRGLGNILPSLRYHAIPLPKTTEKHDSPKPIITPKMQSPAEGAVDRARENMKHEQDGNAEGGEIHGIPVPIKKRKVVKRVSRKRTGQRKGRRKNTLVVNDYFSKK